jgi:hypothetical protein
MLDYIDDMLRQLFLNRIVGLSPIQVGFQPPDDDWRKHVSTLTDTALNVYLVDLRENRRMRSTQRSRNFNQGYFTETPAPRYVDCLYMITAWSPATPTSPAVEPTIYEHEMLWNVGTVLMDADPLEPREIYAPGPLPSSFPALIADAELPTTVLPPEGFAKHAEFWGTMPGQFHPWRPAVFLTLTLPVTLLPIPIGPMVTTQITQYNLPGDPLLAFGTQIEIGGTVFDGTVMPPAPVPGAWVQLASATSVVIGTATTDSRGRFTFGNLTAGNYLLSYRAGAWPPPPPRAVSVPSPTGEYDLTFT